MTVFGKIRKYFSSHFAVSFLLFLSVITFMMLFVFQNYLKREYLQYLMDNSYETENAIMESVQKNVQYSIRRMLEAGGEIGVDHEIYTLAQQSSAGEVSVYSQRLFNLFQDYDFIKQIAAVAVLSRDGLITSYDCYRTDKSSMWGGVNRACLEDMADSFWSDQAMGSFPRYQVFTEPFTYSGFSDRRAFHVVYPLTGGEESIYETDFMLVISYTMDVLEEFVDTIEVPKAEYIHGYVTDGDGTLIYHSDSSRIGRPESELNQDAYTTRIIKDVGYFGWTLNVVIDEQEMRAYINSIYRHGLVVYVLLMAVFIFCMCLPFRRLLRPLHILTESLHSIEEGDYGKRIRIEGEHEVWQIAEEYNRMAEEIESRGRVIEQQHQIAMDSLEQQHQAELEALESQINAHFICNTLGCISYEAIEAGNYDVSVLIKKLSNILRYTLNQKRREVYLRQELAWVDQYLYLQKTRLETVFDYEIHIPEQYGDWPCCKLMLQPFVENSILHGFENREGGGLIRITGKEQGDRLKIVLEDNGRGMDEQTAGVIGGVLKHGDSLSLPGQGNTGIGIRNAVTRMYRYYGEGLEIILDTAPGRGTSFTFLLPLPEEIRRQEEAEEDDD